MVSNANLEKIIKSSLKVSVIHQDESTVYAKIETPSGTNFSVRVNLKDLLPIGDLQVQHLFPKL